MAFEAIKNIGQQLSLSVEDTAQKILDTMGDIIHDKVNELLFEINSHPVYTVKELLYGKQIKPQL